MLTHSALGFPLIDFELSMLNGGWAGIDPKRIGIIINPHSLNRLVPRLESIYL